MFAIAALRTKRPGQWNPKPETLRPSAETAGPAPDAEDIPDRLSTGMAIALSSRG
jgi:hypothetical protein